MKAPKKPKTEALPKIKRRLFRIWSETVRERDGHACAYCGMKRGTLNKNAKKIKCDAHHYLSRDVKNSPLKFDIRNGITLCPEHHKFSGTFSAHKAPISFYEWVRHEKSEHYHFVLDNAEIRVDLENRPVLDEIEKRLKNGEALDLELLLKIEADNPRQIKEKKLPEPSLFDDDDDKPTSE